MEPSSIGLVPYKRDPREPLLSFFYARTQKGNSLKPARVFSPAPHNAGTLILDYPKMLKKNKKQKQPLY